MCGYKHLLYLYSCGVCIYIVPSDWLAIVEDCNYIMIVENGKLDWFVW